MKYPLGSCIEEIMGSQSTARQCLVAAILYQLEAESSASAGGGLLQSKAPALPINGPVDEAKCED